MLSLLLMMEEEEGEEEEEEDEEGTFDGEVGRRELVTLENTCEVC